MSPVPTADSVFDHEMSALVKEIRSAASEQLGSERLAFVTCVTVPIVVG